MDIPSSGASQHTPFIPYDPDVGNYVKLFGFITPWEFTGWKDERQASKTSAHLHAGLNPSQIYRLKGPDALRLLSDYSVNSVAKFQINAAKHLIMCNDEGLVMAHGVAARTGEDEFVTYWLTPWLDFLAATGDYDVQGEYLTGKVFLYQMAGPRSLDILEAATGESLRDIRFLRQRTVTIAGATVNILRMGMAGSLGYELHGSIEDAQKVYDAVIKAGEPFEMRRLGWGSYCNHTEGGFPQSHHDFLFPWFEDPKLAEHLSQFMGAPPTLTGSAGQDIRLRYRTPFELGWGHLVKFDHEFKGRAALEKEAANPKRTMVTLVWNRKDILDVYDSHFEPGQEYKFMEFVQDPLFTKASGMVNNDLVLKDGKTVGITAGRIYSYHYRQMISLCSLDVGEAQIGNEVVVLWGEPGTRQKEIRAIVERFPYFNEDRNETVDVSSLPKTTAAA